MTSLLTFIYLTVSLHEIFNHYRSYQRAKAKRTKHGKCSQSTSHITLPISSPPSQPDIEMNVSQARVERPITLPKRAQTFSHMRLRGDPMLVGIGICQVFVFIYFVLCSELLRHHNTVDDSDEDWGFGQVRLLFYKYFDISYRIWTHGLTFG